MTLEGKNILITGASAGIGQATAILASRLGASVRIVARREDKLRETIAQLEGEGHKYYAADLTELAELETLVKRIVSDGGALDGFVHCAGIAPTRPIKLTRPDYLHEVMQINFYSFVELTRVITKKRNCNDGASIVGISSVAAIKGNKAQGAYTASKAAVASIVAPMAKEFSDRGIRVNAVAFGMIHTQLYEQFLTAGGEAEALKDQYLGIGDTEDAANILCFLLSNASRFITGTVLHVDGGYLS